MNQSRLLFEYRNHIDMKLAQTFQAVEETQFLKQLSSQARLFFIGETEILEYIKGFFKNCQESDSNYYYDRSKNDVNNLASLKQELNRYQAVIVASFADEANLFLQVSKINTELELNIPVLRLFADVFINLVCKQQLLQTTSDSIVKPQVSYAIVTTPRSGSTYFCDLLDSTGVAGYPTEHLRLAAQELARHCNFDYLRLLHNLMQHRLTNNGVFGTKFISHFLFEFKQTKPKFKQIFNSLDKFIFLTRKDKLAQAVSLVIAQTTQVWHIRDRVNDANYQAQLESIIVDDALLTNVAKKYEFINRQEARLHKILAAHKIQPLLLTYEDLVEDPRSQINYVLNFLEIDSPHQYTIKINSRIKKMPSNISQEIIRQFQHRKSTVC